MFCQIWVFTAKGFVLSGLGDERGDVLSVCKGCILLKDGFLTAQSRERKNRRHGVGQEHKADKDKRAKGKGRMQQKAKGGRQRAKGENGGKGQGLKADSRGEGIIAKGKVRRQSQTVKGKVRRQNSRGQNKEGGQLRARATPYRQCKQQQLTGVPADARYLLGAS